MSIVINGKRYAASRYRKRILKDGGSRLIVLFDATAFDPRAAETVIGHAEVQLAIQEIDSALRELRRSRTHGDRAIVLGDREVPLTRYRGTRKTDRGETLTILLDSPEEQIIVRGGDAVQMAELEIEQQLEDPADARHWKTVGFAD